MVERTCERMISSTVGSYLARWQGGGIEIWSGVAPGTRLAPVVVARSSESPSASPASPSSLLPVIPTTNVTAFPLRSLLPLPSLLTRAECLSRFPFNDVLDSCR